MDSRKQQEAAFYFPPPKRLAAPAATLPRPLPLPPPRMPEINGMEGALGNMFFSDSAVSEIGLTEKEETILMLNISYMSIIKGDTYLVCHPQQVRKPLKQEHRFGQICNNAFQKKDSALTSLWHFANNRTSFLCACVRLPFTQSLGLCTNTGAVFLGICR